MDQASEMAMGALGVFLLASFAAMTSLMVVALGADVYVYIVQALREVQ